MIDVDLGALWAPQIHIDHGVRRRESRRARYQ